MSTIPCPQTRAHGCGGTLVTAPWGKATYTYCDQCGAFAYAPWYAFPTGTDKAANGRAWDAGADRSPEGEPDADVEATARLCAGSALEAAGPAPWDHLGRSLLPTEPQSGDWEFLEEALGREPTEEDRAVFEAAYSDVIEDGRGRLFGARVRDLREYLGATQSAAAPVLQVAPNTIARWERGDLTPTRSAEAGLILQLREVQSVAQEKSHPRTKP